MKGREVKRRGEEMRRTEMGGEKKGEQRCIKRERNPTQSLGINNHVISFHLLTSKGSYLSYACSSKLLNDLPKRTEPRLKLATVVSVSHLS